MYRARSVALSLAALAAVSFVSLVSACASSTDAGDSSSEAVGEGASALHLCAALRGNGEYIYTHFISLARLVEEYGSVDALAGGSSSTITMFVYESIQKNPALHDCTADDGSARTCSAEEVSARTALLLKSVRGYAEAVGVSDGVLGNGGLLELATEVEAQGIEGLLDTDPQAAAAQMKKLLSPSEIARLKILINPEIARMLGETDPSLLAYDVGEIVDAVKQFGHFSVANNRLFFRPGLVDFDAAARTTFAHAGDFYAGYGPADEAATKRFLDACATGAKGKLWIDLADPSSDVMHMTGADGSPCGDLFSREAAAYLAALDTAPAFASRTDERIGETFPALAATSVLTGDAVGAYADALAAYRSGTFPSPHDVPFDVSFGDVKFGYWGASDDLARVLGNARGYTDLKTKKAISLGTQPWSAILSRSPAEPGLSRLRDLPDGSIAAGGWPDLAPVLALKNLGCEKVVYVTRRQPESVFAVGIAKKLGMSDADESALYDLGNPASGFSQSIKEATGVWCTDWNAFTDSQMDAMAADSYRAPLETRDPFFSSYANVVSATGQPGCTPGASAPIQ